MKNLKSVSLIFLIIFCANAFCSSPGRVEISIQTVGDIDEEMADVNSLDWVYKLEESDRKELLEFFKIIIGSAAENRATLVIGELAGNPYANIQNGDKYRKLNHNTRRLYFLDAMPANEVKKRAFTTLGQIADLAKNGNTRRIVTLLGNVMPNNSDEYEEDYYRQLPEVFPIERTDSLIYFFRRMDNHAGRGNLHDLFNVSKLVENDDLIQAYDMFADMTSYEYLNYGTRKLYNLEASIMNLEDFGAGFRSFEIWKRETHNLLGTLNLENKPLIIELLSYARAEDYSESNFWKNDNVYFRPRVQRIVGEIFPAARHDVPDGCLRCDGAEYPVEQYKYFVDKYIKSWKLPHVPIAQWNEIFSSQANNCGYFGYDDDGSGSTFRTPCIQTGTFLTSGKNTEVGTFGWDTMPNIRGSIDFSEPWGNNYMQSSITITSTSGCFRGSDRRETRTQPYNIGHMRELFTKLDFDLSNTDYFRNHIGPFISPRNIHYPFFVVISETYEEPIK